MDYDEALFRQLLRKRGPTITLDDVTDVFLVVAWDVVDPILERRPAITRQMIRDFVQKDLAPGLAEGLRVEGFDIR